MIDITREMRVGLFTALAGGVILYMLFVLSPDSFQKDDFKTYYTTVENASGIVENTQVKTNGLTIGKVTALSLEVNRTRIAMGIKADVKIPKGSTLAIKEKGLLGDVFVEVFRSQDMGEYIEEGGFITPNADQISLSALIGVAGGIGRDLKAITENLAAELGGNQGANNIRDIVQNIRLLTETTRAIVQENRQDIRSVIANFEKTTAGLRMALGDRQSDLVSIVRNVKEASDSLRLVGENLKEVLGKDQDHNKLAEMMASFDRTVHQVEIAANDIRTITGKLEKGEGTLGRLISDDTAITELENALKDVREVLAPATKLQIAVDYHGEYRKDKTTQHYFNAILKTRPDKFFILGFTDLKENTYDVETTYRNTNSTDPDVRTDGVYAPTSKHETIKSQKAIKFNLQFAKRWSFATLRFGLFESTGGIGGDFHLFDDRLRSSLEAFDWDSASRFRKTAHFKSYLSLLFYKHLYTFIGVDDPTKYKLYTTSIDPSKNYFVGAGVQFDDEDLKAVMGTAALAL